MQNQGGGQTVPAGDTSCLENLENPQIHNRDVQASVAHRHREALHRCLLPAWLCHVRKQRVTVGARGNASTQPHRLPRGPDRKLFSLRPNCHAPLSTDTKHPGTILGLWLPAKS